MEQPAKKNEGLNASRAVFLLCVAAELLSFLTFYRPWLAAPFLYALGLGAIALAFTDLRKLFSVVVVEAIIGSHGRLFSAEVAGFSVSVRMVLFAVLVIGWALHTVHGRSRILHFRHVGIGAPLTLLLSALALAAARGLERGVGAAFSDANGYAFLLMLPIGLDLFAGREPFAKLLGVMAGAAAWLAAKSLILLYLFSHDFGPFLKDLFRWQRTYGLSEMTRLAGGAVRVFAASDLFLIPAVALGILLSWKFRRRWTFAWTILVTAAFLLSLSRSFWLGIAFSAAIMLPALVKHETRPLREIGRLSGSAFVALAIGTALLAGLLFLPSPKRLQDAGAWGAYGGRFLNASDAAVSSRWNMIAPLRQAISVSPVFGSGFGSVISYQSDDPRMHDLYPGGRVTTGAIEWQYLEIWLKTGLFGLFAVLWLWWRIAIFLWKSIGGASRETGRLMASGAMLSFLAFVIANVFTPYINHPLGWMYLALVVVGAHAYGGHEAPEREFPASPIPRWRSQDSRSGNS